MTGDSWNKDYWKKMVSFLLILGGGGLLLEHLFQFGGFDVCDFIGHEYLGLGMIITAFILSMKWKQMPGLLAAIKNRDIHKILDEGAR